MLSFLIEYFVIKQEMIEMKYEHEITIFLSRIQVVEYYTNLDTLKKWFINPSLPTRFTEQSLELLEGKPWQPGAKTKFLETQNTRYGPRTRVLIHTVMQNDLPDEFVFSIESGGVKTTSYNYYQEEARDVTRWISRNEVEFSGAAKKLSFLMKRGIRSQSHLIMKRFKKQAERAYAHEK